MEVYDERKVGKLLSWKGENLVYHYGEGEVIKFSRFGKIFGDAFKDRLESDIGIAERFFGDRMVPTRVAVSSDGSRKVLLQPFVRGRILRKSDLETPATLEQYRDIMRRHQQMLGVGYPPMDMCGGFGLLCGRLDNLFLLEDGNVRLIDTLLIDISDLGPLHVMLSPLVRAVVKRQEAVIASFSS